MKCFEYLSISIDESDLEKLCALGAVGFDIACSKPVDRGFHLILKRELFGQDAARTLKYYEDKKDYD